MTELRDVRFQQALESAPDAHMAPDARTRQAIQNMAAEAVQSKPAVAAPLPVAWWRRLSGSGSSRMPWNAAFATVLLAGFVTLLWHDKPMPDAQLDEAPALTSSSTPVPAQDSQSGSQPLSQPPAPAQAGVTQKPPTDAAASTSQRQRQGGTSEARKQAPARERAANQAAANVAAPAPAPIAPSAPAAPEAADSRSMAPSARGGVEVAQDPAPALPPIPPSTSSAAPGLAAGSAFSRAAPAALQDSPALQGWDTLRITQSGQTTQLPRAQANALAAQARRLVPTTGSDALPGAISLRIEFVQGDETLAVLELGEEPWLRWTLLRPGFAGRWTGQADRGQLMSLQLELRRLGVGPR